MPHKDWRDYFRTDPLIATEDMRTVWIRVGPAHVPGKITVENGADPALNAVIAYRVLRMAGLSQLADSIRDGALPWPPEMKQ